MCEDKKVGFENLEIWLVKATESLLSIYIRISNWEENEEILLLIMMCNIIYKIYMYKGKCRFEFYFKGKIINKINESCVTILFKPRLITSWLEKSY